eukprot:11787511-Alexandrium_andersonii.AAC.1
MSQGGQGGQGVRVEPASAGVAPRGLGPDDQGHATEAMSDIGGPIYPDDAKEDVDEEMTYLANWMG